MSLDLNAAIYLTHPHDSWERRVEENTHNLLPQFSPKARDLTRVNPGELATVLDQPIIGQERHWAFQRLMKNILPPPHR